MDVIIDGYNLIGSEQGLQGPLERKRNWLIQQLSRYQKATGFAITLVFDGWKSGAFQEVSKKIENIMVVFSRQGEKADNVVVRLARQKGSGCVVISSDREVRNGVERFEATAIYAGEFSEILRHLDVAGNQSAPFDSENHQAGSRKGLSSRLSKTERRRQEKLKKLRLK